MNGEGSTYGGKSDEGREYDEAPQSEGDESEEGQEDDERKENDEDARKEARNLINELERDQQQEEPEKPEENEDGEEKDNGREGEAEKVEADEDREDYYRAEAEKCVKEAVEDMAEKEEERRAREESEEEFRQFQDEGCEARKESAYDDNLSDWEKDVLDNFEKYGVDPNDVKDQWEAQFTKDVEDELGESSEEPDLDEKKEDDPEDETGTGKTEDTESYHDDGSGQMYATKTESSEQAENSTETEAEEEAQESEQESSEAATEAPESPTSGENAEPKHDQLEDDESSQQRGEVSEEPVRNKPLEGYEEPQPPENTPKRSAETSEYHENEMTRSSSASTMEYSEDADKRQGASNTEKKIESSSESEVHNGESEISEDIESSEAIESEEEETSESEVLDELSSEDERWKEFLDNYFSSLPEELRERFSKALEDVVEDEEDFEELAKKHGHKEILEDEEDMEEIREFLRFKKAFDTHPEKSLEEIAEELGLDIEQAENWTQRKNHPEALKQLLQLEGYHRLDLFLRNFREVYAPQTEKELNEFLQNNPMLELLNPMAPFEQWEREARAWIFLKKLQREGKIQAVLRSGREKYHRKQIEELGNELGVSSEKVVSWLISESTPYLIEQASNDQKQIRKQVSDVAYEHLLDAYREMYFYFKDQQKFDNYLRQVGDSLGIKKREDIIEHIMRMQPQRKSRVALLLSPRYLRIKGELCFTLNHLMGKNLRDLEGKISRLTKRSGRGGIQNPKFPEGEQLAIALSRFVATMLTDGHLKPNGTVEFHEPERSRIRRVEMNLRNFGDIKLNPKFIPKDNVYVCYFPAPLGLILMKLGVSSGNKSFLNHHVPSFILNGSLKTQWAFFEDFVPQDGSVSSSSFHLYQSTAIHPGNKARAYPQAFKVNRNLIQFIKKHGKNTQKCWTLQKSKLVKLKKSTNPFDAKLANELEKEINRNRNNILDDCVRMAQSFGVEMEAKANTIRYFKKSKKVSVAWVARTINSYEMVKLGILAPPNDVRKRKIVRDSLRKRSKMVKKAMRELAEKGMRVEEWWK